MRVFVMFFFWRHGASGSLFAAVYGTQFLIGSMAIFRIVAREFFFGDG
jgi:hypothetical protein